MSHPIGGLVLMTISCGIIQARSTAEIRNDDADCAYANACDAYCYGCSDGELGDAVTHLDPPSSERIAVPE
jgi:hypothetical protein